jgi:hypothetical protein
MIYDFTAEISCLCALICQRRKHAVQWWLELNFLTWFPIFLSISWQPAADISMLISKTVVRLQLLFSLNQCIAVYFKADSEVFSNCNMLPTVTRLCGVHTSMAAECYYRLFPLSGADLLRHSLKITEGLEWPLDVLAWFFWRNSEWFFLLFYLL